MRAETKKMQTEKSQLKVGRQNQKFIERPRQQSNSCWGKNAEVQKFPEDNK